MAVSPFSKLSSSEQAQLLDDIYYLNMGEFRQFCDAHGIPYRIYIESKGRVIRTSDCDRKGIVIDRILHFLRTGKIKPKTVFPASVVAVERLGHYPRESDRVLYGQYKSGDPHIGKLMKGITDGKFAFGALSQVVIRECWSQGNAPTYAEFARMWLDAVAAHKQPNREWAYLTDLANGNAGSDWKKLRIQKAAATLSLLRRMLQP